MAAFLPVILALFFFLSLLEDTGYLRAWPFRWTAAAAPGAERADRAAAAGLRMQRVPAVRARTLPTRRDRALTIVLTPCMSCSAKAPVYAALPPFFPQRSALGVSGAVRSASGRRWSQPGLLGCMGRQEAAPLSWSCRTTAGRTRSAASDAAANAEFSRGRSRSSSRRAWACGCCGRSHPRGAWRQCRREPAGRGGTGARAGVRAAGLRRLARRDRARDRAAGQGDGAVHARRAARRRPDGGAAAGVLPEAAASFPRTMALYAPCVARRRPCVRSSGSRPAAFAAAADIARRHVHRGGRLPHRDMDIRSSRLPAPEVCCFCCF